MTPARLFRPVLVCLALFGGGLMTASCGMVDGDARRFEGMAEHVAAIRLDGVRDASTGTKDEQGAVRPAKTSREASRLKVEVMDPHDLWDVRDGGLRGAIDQARSRAAAAAAPVLVQAATQRVSAGIADGASMPDATIRPVDQVSARPGVTTIQLGAYSSPRAARVAWEAASSGAARSALTGLSPLYESVEVKGRPLTRLKVAAPAGSAVAICRAAAVSDPWCHRRV